MRRFIPSSDVAVSVAARVDQHGARQERLDRQGLGQALPAEVKCLGVHVGGEPGRFPHGFEPALGGCRLRGVGAVLGVGGPEPPLRDLGGAVPTDVDVGGGGVGFGITPHSGLVDRRGCPVELEGAVVANAMASKVGVPDGIAVFRILGQGGDDSPADKRISVGKNLHATLARCGKGALGADILADEGGCLGRCVNGNDFAS